MANKERNPMVKVMIDLFDEWYERTKGVKFPWSPKEAAQMKNLYNSIARYLEDSGQDHGSEEVRATFEQLLYLNRPLAVLEIGDKANTRSRQTCKLQLRDSLTLSLGVNELPDFKHRLLFFVFHITERYYNRIYDLKSMVIFPNGNSRESEVEQVRRGHM